MLTLMFFIKFLLLEIVWPTSHSAILLVVLTLPNEVCMKGGVKKELQMPEQELTHVESTTQVSDRTFLLIMICS